MVAVITAFQPGDALVRACEAVTGQVGAVVVVDDGSPEPSPRLLEACRALGAVVERHETNRGIGAALGTGIATARTILAGVLELGDEGHVLTLDQDSAVEAGYVDALLAAELRARGAGLAVAMTGPERVEGIGGMVARRVGGTLIGREPIQSGLLVPLEAMDELGGFADELFIDGVDSEYYLRATTHGRVAVVAAGTRLAHRLGSAHAVGGRLALVHAAPFRYYYIARNRVILVRRYWRTAPGWCARALAKDARHIFVTTALVPGRRARWDNALAGLRDGLADITGPRASQAGRAG